MSTDLPLHDYETAQLPGKDGFRVRHIPTGQTVDLDAVEVETEVMKSIESVAMAGSYKERRNAVLVRMAMERLMHT